MLRIGILLNSLTVPAWVAECIKKIQDSTFCCLELFIVNTAKPQGHSDLRTLLQRRFYKLDRWKNPAYDILTPRQSINPAGVTVLTVLPKMTEHTDTMGTGDIKKIKDYDLDVILRFGFRILRGDILNIARHGVWSFHHGDNHKYRGGPPCLWEVMHGEKVVGQILQRLDNELDGGQVIDRAWTLAHNASIVKTQHRAFSKSPLILMRNLQRLYNGILHTEENSYYDQPLYKAPGNLKFIIMFMRYFWRQLATRKTKEKNLHWRLLYADANEKSLYKFKELLPAKDRFWADPFVFKWAGRHHVIFEEYVHDKKKGRIAARVLDEHGQTFIVLEEPFHLSYPFPFHYHGNLYMTVDSGLGDLRVYRLDLDKKWVLVYAQKFEHLIHDPTVYHDGNLWWLFFSTTNDTLYLYYANDPLANKWKPHKYNPVVIDARGARPAGGLFRKDGKLFRPAQDYSHAKNYALRLKEIIVLTTQNYSEKDAGSTKPEWNDDVQGIHTMNSSSEYAVFDALYFK